MNTPYSKGLEHPRMLFFLACIIFSIGTIFGAQIHWSLGLTGITLVTSFLIILGWRKFSIFIGMLLIGIFGVFLSHKEYNVRYDGYSKLVEITQGFSGKYKITGTIDKLLYRNDFSNAFRLKVDNIDKFDNGSTRNIFAHGGQQSINIVITISNNLTTNIGDKIQFTSKIRSLINFPIQGFSRYLWYHQIYGGAKIYRFDRIFINNQTWRDTTQEYIKNLIFKGFPRDVAGIILGMSIGNVDLISQNTKEAFIESGIIHILVVSGSNIAFVIILLQGIFRYIPFFRLIRMFIVIFGVILYSMLVGWEIPVLRSVIMGIISYLALDCTKKLSQLAILFLVATILIILSPLSLLYDASFGLSFSATFGIIIFNPIIQQGLLYIRTPRILRDLISVSVGASLGSSMVILYYFGRIPVFSIIANLLIGTILGWILIATVIYIVLGFFGSSILYLWGWSIYIPVVYIMQIGEFFRDSLTINPGVNISHILINISFGLMLYLLFFIERRNLLKPK